MELSDNPTRRDSGRKRFAKLIHKLIDRLIGEKRRWRRYKARAKRLPESYRTAIEAVQRYLMYRGAITNGDVLMSLLEDLADLFEQSAANGTPVRDIVGEDPVEFAEEFLRNYSEGQWIAKEKERLTAAVERAVNEES